MTIDIASQLKHCNSYSRMPTLLHLYDQIFALPPSDEFDKLFDDWFRSLGHYWSSCALITPYSRKLYTMIGDCDDMSLLLMTESERALFFKLPEEVTIYRGCGHRNAHGICWSLEPEVAIRYPFQHRSGVPDPILIAATVEYDDIIALKSDRGQIEIITFSAKEQSRGSLLPTA